MGAPYDTVIIGGGIIGLFTAWELQKAGQSVCVLERGEFGQEASWAAGGILSPLRPWKYPARVNELCLESQALYPAICKELQSISGIDPEWRRSGMLVMDCPEHEQAQAWADENAQTLEWLDAEAIQDRFPELNRDLPQATACWLPDVAQVRNPRLIKALVKTLQLQGAELRSQTEVTGLDIQAERIQGVHSAGTHFAANNVVIAAGAWSGQLLPAPSPADAIYPAKGQMLLFAPVTQALQSIVMRGDRYLVPRADGRVLVGSTVEDAGYDKWTDDETLAELRRAAIDMCPALADARIEAQWAGLRPATRDELPIIQAHDSLNGLFLNTGHFRSGIAMAPASGRRLANLMPDN